MPTTQDKIKRCENCALWNPYFLKCALDDKKLCHHGSMWEERKD